MTRTTRPWILPLLAAALLPWLAAEVDAAVFLEFSTHVGGNAADDVRDVTTDADGNIYLVGSTSSATFAGVSITTAGTDAFVLKLDPTGQQVLFAEVFGGAAFDEAWAVEVDSTGHVYVAGYTTSTTFPTTSATPTLNGYADTPDATDAFLLKLDPTGSVVWGTVYGGPDLDGEFNGGIAVDEGAGRVYIGSRADSTGLGQLGGFSGYCPAAPCSFIAGFDTSLTGTGSLVYASYVTDPAAVSNQEDSGILDLDVDSSGNLYAFGFVNPNSDIVLAGQGFQDASGDLNNNDHFLIKLDPTLAGAAQRVYSTFIGGFGDESERGRIAALDTGVVYVGSKTDSTAATFPELNAVQPENAGGEDGYVAKIDTTLTGASSQLWTTFLGSVQNDEVNAIAVDAAGDAWVAATVSGGASVLFPQVLPLPGSPTTGEDSDAAVARIASDGSAIRFSSSSAAGASAPYQGITVAPNGHVLVAGSRGNASFPRKGGLTLTPTGGSEIALLGLDPTGDLGLVLEARPTVDPALTGNDFAYEYLIHNRGVADAANATLTTDFPAGLVAAVTSGNCSFPGSSATCDLFEDIPRGGNTPLYIVASSIADGSYTVNASVTSDLADPSPGDDADSATLSTDAFGSAPASLVLADFDAVAPAFDIGGFALDTADGVLATPNGTLGDVVNLMHLDGALPFQVERLLGQGEVAFGFVESTAWTPSPGDGSDLFGRDFNASSDRVFAIVDAEGRVELRTAEAFDPGRVIDTGFVPLGRPGLLTLTLTPSTATVLFDGQVVASGDPFTTDFRDADPADVGDDFVISVGFGTEDRGTAVLNVPEPAFGTALMLGACALLGGRRRCTRGDRP